MIEDEKLKFERERYGDIVDQVAKIDKLYNTRLNLCIVVNLALAGAWATLVRLDSLVLLDILLVLLCGLGGSLLNYILNFYMNNNKLHHEHLKKEFSRLTADRFLYPFYLDERKALKLAPAGWSRVPFMALLFWVTAGLHGAMMLVNHLSRSTHPG